MSNNQLGEKGGQYLAPAIGKLLFKVAHKVINIYYSLDASFSSAGNDTIEHLDLSWNHLRNKGACALALSLKVIPKINTLLMECIMENRCYIKSVE